MAFLSHILSRRAFRRGSPLDRRSPRELSSLEGGGEARTPDVSRVFIPYCLVSRTFFVSPFSSSRQDVPFTRVLKGGNRNDRLTSRVNVTVVVTAFESAATNISIISKRRKITPWNNSPPRRRGRGRGRGGGRRGRSFRDNLRLCTEKTSESRLKRTRGKAPRVRDSQAVISARLGSLAYV